MGSKVNYGQLVGTFNGLNWTFRVSVRAYRRPEGIYEGPMVTFVGPKQIDPLMGSMMIKGVGST